MANTKLSALGTAQTTLGASDRLYLYDATNQTDEYVTPATLVSHTGDVTGGLDGVLTIAADAVDGTHIADDSIDSEHYAANSIDNEHLAADCVTGAEIADDAIDSEHYTNGSIDTAHYAASSVDATALATNSVTTAKVTDANITRAKLSNLDQDHIIVRVSAGSGVPEDRKISELDEDTGPGAGDWLLMEDSAGILKCVDIDNLPSSASAADRTINTQTDTTYELAVGDASKVVTFNNPSTITVTIPTSTFTAGQRVDWIQLGAGQVQFTTSGTLNSPETDNAEKQYASGSVTCYDTDKFILAGQLELA